MYQVYKSLKHYISEAGCASIFMQEAPIDQAILSHWVSLKHSQL